MLNNFGGECYMVMLSPGVTTNEKDYSAYIPAISTSTLGVVLTAGKGPVGTETLITNEGALVNTFGEPTNDELGILACMQYLTKGNQLYVVRSVGQNAKEAMVDVKDSSASTTGVLKLKAPHVGSWYNDKVKMVISNVKAESFTFDATVVVNGSEVLKKYGVSMDPLSENYVEDAFKGVEDLLVEDLLDGAKSHAPKEGTYVLTGGSNGNPVTASDIVKSLNRFTNSDTLMINLLACPGFSQAAVINEMLSICENRGDALALIDAPFGLKPQEVIKWHNGQLDGADYPKQALNSSYGALYWSWLKVLNPYSGKEVWTPPSGLVAAVYAHNDSVAEAWFAPAGFKRGRMVKPLEVEYSPDGGERDALYGGGSVVNPIVNFATDGITIWGQRTLQRQASATDRVNVRRLLLMARRSVALSTKYFTFEQNDEFTWEEWKDMVEPFFASIKARRGLYDYMVQMDASTVTNSHIDRGEMPGRIFLQPTKTAEFIPIDFVLTATGASFSE